MSGPVGRGVTDNPNLVSYFHLISICNVYFKIISKIVASRLKLFLPKLIGREQARFLLVIVCYPFDNIITFQEVGHSIERETNGLFS